MSNSQTYPSEQPAEVMKRWKAWNRKNPWTKYLKYARRRCTDPNHKSFPSYGGRGIICYLTIADVRKLWLRDKAYEMKRPSLDRRDVDANYTYENCRFMEYELNAGSRDFLRR